MATQISVEQTINTLINEIEREECETIKFYEEGQHLTLLKLNQSSQKLKAFEAIVSKLYKRASNVEKRTSELTKKIEEITNVRKEEQNALDTIISQKIDLEKGSEKLKEVRDKYKNEIQDKQLAVENYKKALRACKLLTSTHFDFGSVVCGYTLTQDLKYKCFELNPQERSQDEITEHLWRNLSQLSTFKLNRENVSSQDKPLQQKT